jgi:hypothetical protein
MKMRSIESKQWLVIQPLCLCLKKVHFSFFFSYKFLPLQLFFSKLRVKHKFAYILIPVLLVCIAVGASGAPKSQIFPSEFTYETVPFGSTESEIIGWLERQPGVVVHKDEGVSISNFASYEPIGPFFSHGVRKNGRQEASLEGRLVRKYIINGCASVFPKVFRMELYFVQGLSYLAEYRLFMVWCMSHVTVGTMNEVYTAEMEKRVVLHRAPDSIWAPTTYYETYRANADTVIGVPTPTDYLLLLDVRPHPAIVSLWQFDNGAAFFMMNDNGMLHFREYLLVSRDGWSNYLKGLAEMQMSLSERFTSSKKSQPAKK